MSVWRRSRLLVNQDSIRSNTDLELAFEGVRLPLFVERHHDGGGSIAPDLARALSLNAASPSFNLKSN